MSWRLKGCPACHGDLFQSPDDGAWECFACGRQVGEGDTLSYQQGRGRRISEQSIRMARAEIALLDSSLDEKAANGDASKLTPLAA